LLEQACFLDLFLLLGKNGLTETAGHYQAGNACNKRVRDGSGDTFIARKEFHNDSDSMEI
jgi:hypothetical protein